MGDYGSRHQGHLETEKKFRGKVNIHANWGALCTL